jgi:hypothetical protein
MFPGQCTVVIPLNILVVCGAKVCAQDYRGGRELLTKIVDYTYNSAISANRTVNIF